MAEEELKTVELRDDFYRDGIGKITIIGAGIFFAIALVVSLSLYLHFTKPPPLVFAVANDWRIQSEVPLGQPYLSITDLLQWAGNTIPIVFNYDFIDYNEQLKNNIKYFTANGWKVFLNYLNSYVNYTNVQSYRLFVTAIPKGAPVLLNQGLLSGRYGWWIQMPIEIKFAGFKPGPNRLVTFQVLIVRVSTLNNLSGVAIENMIIATPNTNQAQGSSS